MKRRQVPGPPFQPRDEQLRQGLALLLRSVPRAQLQHVLPCHATCASAARAAAPAVRAAWPHVMLPRACMRCCQRRACTAAFCQDQRAKCMDRLQKGSPQSRNSRAAAGVPAYTMPQTQHPCHTPASGVRSAAAVCPNAEAYANTHMQKASKGRAAWPLHVSSTPCAPSRYAGLAAAQQAHRTLGIHCAVLTGPGYADEPCQQPGPARAQEPHPTACRIAVG